MFTKIKYKLLFFFLLVGVIPLIATIYIEYQQVSDTLRQRSFDQLTTVREIKKKKIEQYFNQIRKELSFFSQTTSVIEAMKEFQAAFRAVDTTNLVETSMKAKIKQHYQQELLAKIEVHERDTFHLENILPQHPTTVFLQSQYLIGNKSLFKPHPYHEVHEKYHLNIANFLATYGYYDIFLIDDQTGHIVYSVVKEVDFATSLLTDAYKDTNIGRLFRALRHSGVKNQVLMYDFEPYLPSYLAPAAFIGTPIFEGDTKIGTLIFQIPIDRIDAVMTNNKSWREEGFGESGESYIVGSDYKMRSNSRFIIEDAEGFLAQLKKLNTDSTELQLIEFYNTTVLFQSIHTEAASKAIGNRKGTEIIKDYRGIDVLSSFTPLDIPDVKWVLLSEIDAEEAFAPVYAFAWRSLQRVLVVTVIIVLVSFLIARSISAPIMMLVTKTQEMSKGNLDIRAEITSKDEIGQLAQSFNENAQALKEQHNALLEKQNEITQQMEEISTQSETLRTANEEIALRNEELRQNMEEIESQRDDIIQKTTMLEHQKEEIAVQAENMKEINAELEEQNQLLEEQRLQTELKAQQLKEAKQQVEQILEDLQEKQRIIERSNKDTFASINYAKRIQDAMLPPIEEIQAQLPESFIFYEPKNIVSGDFYWFAQKDQKIFIAAVDCTGHGVPGAFMSVIGHDLLHEIILTEGTSAPDSILNALHQGVRTALKQEVSKIRDGMDIALCVIDTEANILSFAGAGNPLYYVEQGEMKVIKGNNDCIGGFQKAKKRQFQMHQVSLEKDNPQASRMFYIFSDGFQDQFGGKHDEKFMSKRFRNFLHSISFMPIDLQYQKLKEEFFEWKGKQTQTDDVLVIGFRI